MLQMGLIYPQLLLKHMQNKEELQIGCIRIYLIFPNLRGLSLAPNPGKLKFLIGFLSKSSQYNINVRYELSFL